MSKEDSYLQSIVYDFGGNDDIKNKAILSYLNDNYTLCCDYKGGKSTQMWIKK